MQVPQSTIDSVSIIVEAIDVNSSLYRVTIRNSGQECVENGILNYESFIGPHDFGLDDTHMWTTLKRKPALRFTRILPGEKATFEVEGYGLPLAYRNSKQRSVQMIFRKMEIQALG